MRTEKQQLEILYNILGNPLPEIDPIYYECKKIWGASDPNPLLTPYICSYMYTKEEMKLVLELPGDSKQIASKLNLNEKDVEEKLHNLMSRGRIVPSISYTYDATGYAPTYNIGNLTDQIVMAKNAHHEDLNTEEILFKLAYHWIELSIEYEESMKDSIKDYLRIVPKWNAIKNIPGVMDCENVPLNLIEAYHKNELINQKCLCESSFNLEHYGTSYPNKEIDKTSIIKEDFNEDGHCFWFNKRADYMRRSFNAPVPKSIEFLKEKIKECEESDVVYTAKNSRIFDQLCSCRFECCHIFNYHKLGYDVFIPSRFLATINANKCVGCKECSKHCFFDAISFNKGMCSINPDKCKGCGNCCINCPSKAIKMKIVRNSDWIPEIMDPNKKIGRL